VSASILVVDDAPLIREPIAAALTHAGFTATCASDGAEALSIIRGRRVDLLILDLEMPGMNGVETLRHLAAAPGTAPPVIVLTASQDKTSVLTARQLGVRHFLLKSTFSLDLLVTRIKQMLAETPPASAAA
jgi:CheY-like chemotaxis protein